MSASASSILLNNTKSAIVIGSSIATSYFAYKFRNHLPFLAHHFPEESDPHINYTSLETYKALTPATQEQLQLLSPLQSIRHNFSYQFQQKISPDIIQRILYGGSLVHQIANNYKYSRTSKSHKEQLEDIINISYYFFSEALAKNQVYDEGSFVIHDKNFRIYEFLMDYVKSCNQNVTGTIKDPAFFKANNPYAYPRISTHHKKSQKKFRQYGIDIRFSPDHPLQTLLPNHKAHILFGKINEQKELLFFKIERYGLVFTSEFLGHTYELIRSQSKKIAKKIPFINSVFANDEHPSFRCEYIPHSFKQRCQEIFDETKKTVISCGNELLKNLSLVQDECASHGIYFLYELGQQPEIPEELSLSINKYIHELAQELDHLQLRTGREVIIGQKEFDNALQYHKFINKLE